MKTSNEKFLEIQLTDTDNIFIRDGNENIGCGNINDDGHLYFIEKTMHMLR